jgi:acyl carrier protein
MQQQIRRFILTSFLFTEDESQLGNDDSLLDRGIMDSTGVLELVAFLETEFAVKVADEELVPENLDSVSKIVAFVSSKKGASVPAGSAAV